MQNLGFVYALTPLIRSVDKDQRRVQVLLSRHMQFFNSHPYMAPSILGSVVRMEEKNLENEKTLCREDALTLKNTLSGPYAAIGDSFFWGAYRPLSALAGVLFAVKECPAAPLLTFLFYNTVHLWIRWKGFAEGYRLGRQGIEFIRRLDLPGTTGRIRWVSLSMLALLAALFSARENFPLTLPRGWMVMEAGVLLCILLCFWGIKRGISPVSIWYGAVMLVFLLVH